MGNAEWGMRNAEWKRRGGRVELGTLWRRLVAQTEHGLRCGALQPMPTAYEFVEDGGVDFLVRVSANLARKDAARKQQPTASAGQAFNPFLPYEEDLFVADLSETHLCLLNKFNVLDHHLLIVTRAFEEQEALLNQQDFAALWTCMAEFEGLAFYNAGAAAGASQRHKHLQLVPLPVAPEGPPLPIEPALAAATFQGAIGTVPAFPFAHAVVQLDANLAPSPSHAAAAVLTSYHMLLHATGLSDNVRSRRQQAAPYNLLITRQWMLLIPRSQDRCESVSVNALGFAGAFLVRNAHQLQQLKNHGPMHVLRHVALPAITQ